MIRTVLKFLLPILITLMFFEVGLRLVGKGFPRFHKWDETYGVRPIPEAEGWFVDEGKAYIKMNQAGFRDVDHSKKKESGVFRVAILGDSFGEAMQVDMRDTFWKALERDLNLGCSKTQYKKFEVLNFSVTNWGSAQELLLLQNEVLEYDPDYIVQAFFTGNDLWNNYKPLEKTSYRPHMIWKKDHLEVERDFWNDPYVMEQRSFKYKMWNAFLDHSFIVQVVNRAYQVISSKINKTEGKQQKVGWEEPGLKNEVFVDPQSSEVWVKAWDITEKILLQTKNVVIGKGKSYLLLIVNMPIQVHPDKEKRRKFQDSLGVKDLTYPDRRLKQFSKKHHIEVLATADFLLPEAESKKEFFHGFQNTEMGFGHWNEKGHNLVGKQIGSFICNQIKEAI